MRGTEAPSIIADSSNDCGMPLTTPVKMNTAEPAPNPKYTMHKPHGVLSFSISASFESVNITIWNGTIMLNRNSVYSSFAAQLFTRTIHHAHIEVHTKDQNHRADRDQQGPAEAGEEIRGFNATGIVFNPTNALPVGMENALREMYAFCLKELMITSTIGENPCQRDQGKQYGPQSAVLDLFSGNHASTSLEVVSLF